MNSERNFILFKFSSFWPFFFSDPFFLFKHEQICGYFNVQLLECIFIRKYDNTYVCTCKNMNYRFNDQNRVKIVLKQGQTFLMI